MISTPRRHTLLLITVMLILTLAGCHGFFVNPTLSSLSVTPPNPNLQIGSSLQMIATGNFSDGTTGSVSGVTWTSSLPSQVSVSSGGLIKGLANTSSGVTITATSGGVSGSTTVTVGQSSSTGGSSTLIVTANSGNSISLSRSGGMGASVTFTAIQNGNNVTSSATWISSNTAIITTPSAGVASLGGQTGTVRITATASGFSGSVQITVTP